MASDRSLQILQKSVWDARLPLQIGLAASECRTFDVVDPYMIAWPRISYLPLLLPRLHSFFANDLIADATTIDSGTGYFSYDGVPLKWHYPLGLLYDMYVLAVHDTAKDDAKRHALPFKLTLHFSSESHNVTMISPSPVVMHDSFINSVKEADFLRTGNANPIMTLPESESKALWTSTQANDLETFANIHQTLLPAPSKLKNIPLRIFLPASNQDEPSSAQMKVLQAQVSPMTVSNSSTPASARVPTGSQSQTLGTALNTLLPSLFPSRRTPVLAKPLLHGAPLPMGAKLDDLVRWACYADGWLSVVVAING